MALPAQLHASAALTPYCLKNCDADEAGQKLENLSKRGMVWERDGSSRRKDEVQQDSVQVQKKGSHLQENCSKVQ